MSNAKQIKNRIKSIQDTRKITNAMYMIASAKMKKAKNDLDSTRPYFDALYNEIQHIFQAEANLESRYFSTVNDSEEPVGTTGILVITADRGLVGSYNKSVIKATENIIPKYPYHKLFVVGEYGRRFFARQQVSLAEDFLDSAQNPTVDIAREISNILLDQFERGELEQIIVVYSDLESSLTTKVNSTLLLPIQRRQSGSIEVAEPFEFYPSIDDVLSNMIRIWLSGFIYGALVGSFCSEQSSRMVAMNSANKNAEEILDALSLKYNQLRQSAITEEVTEVIAGAKAQKRKRKKEVAKQ